MSTTLIDVVRVYQGSSGDDTRALCARLEALGDLGRVAAFLFRAQKASERAKVYRGGGYRVAAYERKSWAMRELVAVLEGETLTHGRIRWGWGQDLEQRIHKWVLYVELPTGQVSFHTDARGDGPDYPPGWDGRPGQSPDRILRWCARLLEGRG